MTVTSRQIIEAARGYLGIKWGHQGRAVGERHRRIDCIGLICCTMRDVGIPVSDRTNYLPMPDGSTLQRELGAQLVVCRDRKLVPGRIVAFDDVCESSPCHVGILTDHPSGIGVIHASASEKKVIEHRLDDTWRGQIRGVYRFAEGEV